MPVIHVSMLRGRPVELKREFARRMTDLVSEMLQVDRDLVVIYLDEYARENVAKDGELYTDRPGGPR